MNSSASAPFLSAQDGLSIDRQGLAYAVTAKLRDMIVEGILQPGSRLNERILCEQLMVSRTPLRVAFLSLVGVGLVDIQPNRGAVVAEMTMADIEQTFEVMGALEGFSGQLACERITDKEIAEIRALHYEMLATHARQDLPSYYKLNHLIHDRINAAARNSVLTATYLQLNARIQSLRFRSNFTQEKWNAAVKEHSSMFDVLISRDCYTLCAVLQYYLCKKFDSLVTVLQVANVESGRAHQK